jgi:hypothetical protein
VTAWFRHGVPAAISVLLGAGVAILTNLVTSSGPGPGLIAGLATFALVLAGWEAWRAVRGAPGGAVLRGEVSVRHVQGAATGVEAPADVDALRIEGRVDADTVGGDATGVRLRGDDQMRARGSAGT